MDSGYSVEFNSRSLFSFPNFDWGNNAIIFWVDNSSSLHIDNKKKYILVLGEGQTQGLDDTVVMAEAKYSINFTRLKAAFCFKSTL